MCQAYPSWSVNRGVTPAPATRALTAAAAATSSSQSNTAPSAGLKAWTVRRSASLSSPSSLTWCEATNAASAARSGSRSSVLAEGAVFTRSTTQSSACSVSWPNNNAAPSTSPTSARCEGLILPANPSHRPPCSARSGEVRRENRRDRGVDVHQPRLGARLDGLVHPLHEAGQVSGLGLDERLTIGRAQLDDHHGVAVRVQARPDMHVAVAARFVEPLTEQVAAERPAHLAGTGHEHRRDGVRVARVVLQLCLDRRRGARRVDQLEHEGLRHGERGDVHRVVHFCCLPPRGPSGLAIETVRGWPYDGELNKFPERNFPAPSPRSNSVPVYRPLPEKRAGETSNTRGSTAGRSRGLDVRSVVGGPHRCATLSGARAPSVRGAPGRLAQW